MPVGRSFDPAGRAAAADAVRPPTTAAATGPGRRADRDPVRTRARCNYLVTAPGDLGLARAYVAGRPRRRRRIHRPTLRPARRSGPLQLSRPTPGRAARAARLLGSRPCSARRRSTAAAGGARLRGTGCGTRKRRDAEAIRHHYDVSQRVLRVRPGPVDGLHLRGLPDEDATLEQAQDDKFDLVCRKLGLQPGHAPARRRLRLGRHGPARRPALRRQGPRRHAVARSRPSGRRSDRARGLSELAEVRHRTTATSPRRGSTPSASIGLTEHIGVAQLPGVLPVPARQAAARRPPAQPLHHPARQPRGAKPRRFHRPVRVPRR